MTDHSGFSLSRRALIQAGVAAGVAALRSQLQAGLALRGCPSRSKQMPARSAAFSRMASVTLSEG